MWRRQFGSSSKAWLQRQQRDPLVGLAKEQDLRARSAFKLQEIQEKHKIITPSSIVVDLGAAPGGWSTIASKIVRPQAGGGIIAIDLLPIQPIAHTTILRGDFTTAVMKQALRDAILEQRKSNKTDSAGEATVTNVQVDVLLSDMLHNTTGVHDMDHYKSIDLVNQAIAFATQPTPDFLQGILHPKGSIVCKYLRGEDEKELVADLKERFQQVHVIKPKSSRAESREAFLLMRNLKQ